MKKILLICSTGMTSAKVVSEMKLAAVSRAEEYLEIWSAGVAEIKTEVTKADIVLLSPQSSYLEDTVSELLNENTVLKKIPGDVYSSLNGKEIVDFALE